jgi:UDP-2,4-diacetamido-2,4,6-trideoxy-beta-L-altropyranose hydrolase
MGRHKIYFRADGNSQIGLGHISRCCALAQMLNENFDCIFIIRDPLPETKKEMLKICSAIVELPGSKDLIREAEEISKRLTFRDIIVLDGYSFITEYQKIIKETGCLLVCIDDIYSYHFVSDAIINHAGGILPGQYSKEFYTQLYLGPEYAMLRLPFHQGRDKLKRQAPNNNVLILLGGADRANETKKILEQCYKAKPGYKYHVVVGAAYSWLDELKEFLDKRKDLDATVYRSIEAGEIVSLMKKCQTAITAPSTVALEYLFIGGFLYLHTIADNQKNIYKYFIENGFAGSFNDFIIQENTPGMKKEARFEYDFVENLRKVFSVLAKETQLTIKKVTPVDVELVFKWINDPVVRRQSYSTALITWETHSAWFQKKMNDKNYRMYLFYLKDDPAGQIRFDIENTSATLSYLIDEEHRGKGLGSMIIKKGILSLRAEKENIKQVVGFVKKNNIPSSRSFRKLGFVEEDAHEYPDSFRYTLSL